MKLTQINIYDKDKNGQPLITKTGKPYQRMLIKVNEHGEVPISGFAGEWNRDWKVGDEVRLKIEERLVNGVMYLNFSKLDPIDELETRIAVLETEVRALKNQLNYPQGFQGEKEPGGHIEDLPEEEDLPF